MNNLNGIELLETLVNCAHYLKNIYQTDAIVGVTDKEKFLMRFQRMFGVLPLKQ